jgi:hypothetical protein
MLDRFGGSVVVITIGILALLTLAIAVAWSVARRRKRIAQERPAEIPLFTVPVSSLVSIPRPPNDALQDSALHANVESYSHVSPTIRTRDGEVSTLARPGRDLPALLPDDGASQMGRSSSFQDASRSPPGGMLAMKFASSGRQGLTARSSRLVGPKEPLTVMCSCVSQP